MSGSSPSRLGWLLGVALIGAVVLVALRFSEAEDFARLAERAQPKWLFLAALLQATTYLAEGQIWRVVVRAGRYTVAIARAYGLSVAKLFVDQTVPSGGISGTVLYVQGLQRAGSAILCQFAIVCLDAGTVWAALRAVGSSAPMAAVLASFVLSSLFRTLSIVPGGLGTFEAASVYTLQSLGLPVPAALSATLIFRGLSFWLPMIPGMVLARRFTT